MNKKHETKVSSEMVKIINMYATENMPIYAVRREQQTLRGVADIEIKVGFKHINIENKMEKGTISIAQKRRCFLNYDNHGEYTFFVFSKEELKELMEEILLSVSDISLRIIMNKNHNKHKVRRGDVANYWEEKM